MQLSSNAFGVKSLWVNGYIDWVSMANQEQVNKYFEQLNLIRMYNKTKTFIIKILYLAPIEPGALLLIINILY